MKARDFEISLLVLSAAMVAGCGARALDRFDVPNQIDVARIDTTGNATCALFKNGTADCWGLNIDRTFDKANAPPLVAVAASRLGTCGLTELGEVLCWDFPPDRIVPEGPGFVAISGGEFDVCALHANGTIRCLDPRYGTDQVLNDFIQVSTGTHYVCGLRKSGEIACWGVENAEGQATPPQGDGFVSVAAGQLHSCALRADGKAVCWGKNSYGQLNPVGEFAP